MSEEALSIDSTFISPEHGGAPACAVCSRPAERAMVALGSLPEQIRSIIEANTPSRSSSSLVCQVCLGLFQRACFQLQSHAALFDSGGRVLPTPLRLDADDRFTGRGVTIAFLDSGFYAHTDLTTPSNRILAYHSIVASEESHVTLETPDDSSWHGMMTSVVAAGNGSLSGGFYRGISPDANVVLVKIGKTARIPEENIELGLRWVMDHRHQYGIRVVNISAGGDYNQSYLHNSLAQTVERAVREGLTVVCAVGNAGMSPGHAVLPPASAPSSIAVGGLDDQNSLDRARRGMYRSSYGPTIDGLQKPEVIAPGIWVAAPILPHTQTAQEARYYASLDKASDDQIRSIIEARHGMDQELDQAHGLPIPLLRQLITIKLREGNVISRHYKYVDGTSFASPIVASIVACMLEANPSLTPQQIKRILIRTAQRLPSIEVERQGWGVVTPRRAVEVAVSMRQT
jgi:serine protease AprX